MKEKRQEKILELVGRYEIGTQDDLIERLRTSGFPATQATVSRDIRDLRLTKVQSSDGVYRYVQQSAGGDAGVNKLNVQIFSSVRSADYAGNIVVIKTIPSMASAVAAGIDEMELREVLGCVAGDDCIIAVTRTENDASAICNRLRELIRLS